MHRPLALASLREEAPLPAVDSQDARVRHTSSPRRAALRTSAVLCSFALSAGALTCGTAHAAPNEAHINGGSHENTVLRAQPDPQRKMNTALIHLKDDLTGSDVGLYCIEMDVPIDVRNRTVRYIQREWSSYNSHDPNWSKVSGKVAWIAANSFPSVAPEVVLQKAGINSPMDKTRIVAATQAAIWHYTQGFVPSKPFQTHNVGNDESAEKLYEYLVANATDVKAPKVTPSFSLNSISGTSNTTLKSTELTASAETEITAKLPQGAQLLIDGKPANSPVKLPQGKHTISIKAGAEAGTASVEAVAQGELAPAGTVWYSHGKQSLITAKAGATKVTAEAHFIWSPAPAKLSTTAIDKADNDKKLSPNGGTVVDTIRYSGLKPGTTYKVKGLLMDKATGKSTGITGEGSFTPTSESGTTTVSFQVPAGHAGRSLVAFEQVITGDTLVASHEDINSPEQTVTVDAPPPPPTTTKPGTPPVTPPSPPNTPPATPPNTPPTPPNTPELPVTGSQTLLIAGGGLALLAAGGSAIYMTRRRSAKH
ncbi:hypothetical protein KEM60_00148 [Austwickia sp. TVS 96-490-7B]|uniref:VaFE repeat-containing surface-anchored protein n=1 Tax=Austwickia sp. TVS 96-490-7B TaxID=2830843 RepID=UPI001C575542|nr:VaFE repeat-containing surface-anchored protein [Austwickia sp. TVS 96-490-7B]MBW3083965.1 hypothetical protein [Austwickia sp. TVS 96-490-7B]